MRSRSFESRRRWSDTWHTQGANSRSIESSREQHTSFIVGGTACGDARGTAGGAAGGGRAEAEVYVFGAGVRAHGR